MFHPHPDRDDAPEAGTVEPPFPWETPHAPPADRALGLELELIELVRRREELADWQGPTAGELEEEIAEVMAELAETAAQAARRAA